MPAPYTGNTTGADSSAILQALNDIAVTPTATTSRLLSAAGTTNATSVKASAGWLFAATLYNASAAAKFLKFYNKASAPTVGTDTPALTFLIPAGGTYFLDRPTGIYFSTGIAYALTGAAADADTTALAAGDILCMNLEYA